MPHAAATGAFPILVFHRESGAVLAANDAAVRVYGGTRKELFGCLLGDLFPPDDDGGTDLARVHDEGMPWTGSWMLRRRDGTTVWSTIGMIDAGDAAEPATMILVVDTDGDEDVAATDN